MTTKSNAKKLAKKNRRSGDALLRCNPELTRHPFRDGVTNHSY